MEIIAVNEYLRERVWLSMIIMLQFSLFGCAHQEIATQRYPQWGERVLLVRPDNKPDLHMRILRPSDKDAVVGCLLIVHGMNEYVGRYVEIATYFSKRFIVGGVDLRGHGLSNPTLFAADRAIAAGADSYDVSSAYLDQAQLRDLVPMRADLRRALRYLADRCDADNRKRKPLFILSHSLGALVTASYLLERIRDADLYNRVAGVIFVGPAFSVTEVPGWRGWFQNPFIDLTFHIHEHFLSPHDEPLPLLIINQVSSFILVPLLDGVIEVLSWPYMRRVFSPTTPDWVVDYLTDWDTEKARHKQDAYIIRRSILRFVLGVEAEIIKFRRSMAEFDLPYLLIYSAHDPIAPAWGSEDFAALTLHNHADNQVLPLADKNHHEQLFSAPPLARQLFGEIDRWLDRRLEALAVQ